MQNKGKVRMTPQSFHEAMSKALAGLDAQQADDGLTPAQRAKIEGRPIDYRCEGDVTYGIEEARKQANDARYPVNFHASGIVVKIEPGDRFKKIVERYNRLLNGHAVPA